jgi:zinc resistance-associated protein
MKKEATKIIGIGFLLAVLAVPAVALAHGWGRGRMMGNWGTGPGYGYMMPYGPGNETLTPDQRTQLDQLDRKFYEDTASLRKDLWDKSYELNTILNSENPDLTKVKALNKEINDLGTQLQEKGLNYQLEIRKIIPETAFGGGYGRSFGYHMWGHGPGAMGPGMRGFGGRGMMGYGGPGMMGYGPGMGGYGPGTCRY